MINEPEKRRGHLLVVDDDESILATLRATLYREGYEVTTLSDPLAALALLKTQEFAVILSDQQMPRLSGPELLGHARLIQPDATRILITGVVNLNTIVDSINKGEIYRFIVKPWLREELLATVQNAVQRCELIRRTNFLQAQTLEANKALAAQIARVAEQNRELEAANFALQQNLDQSVRLCLKTLDAFWPVLSNQAHRVRELCRAMAATLQLAPAQRQVLDIAALLHDIGLIEVHRDVIRKWRETPELLDEIELGRIRHHPILGQELVGFVDSLKDVGQTIRAHHERFDGTGYPDRLCGDSIPWLARLLTIAVDYATFPQESLATDFIKANSGTAFDPEAVRSFLRSLPQVTLPRRQREVLLSELRPGMVLADGIYSSSGLLLVSEGQALSEPYIDRLRSRDRVDPLALSLIVYG